MSRFIALSALSTTCGGVLGSRPISFSNAVYPGLSLTIVALRLTSGGGQSNSIPGQGDR